MAPLKVKAFMFWVMAAAMCPDTRHCVELCQAIEGSIGAFLLEDAAKEVVGQLSTLLVGRS